MAVVRWTPEALRDLEDVHRFLSRSSPMAANSTVERLLDTADRLGDFPELGTVVSELSRSRYRQVVVGAYRLFYRFDSDAVFMGGIVSARRRLRPGDLN